MRFDLEDRDAPVVTAASGDAVTSPEWGGPVGISFGATDRGYRVIIVEDAVASSSPAGHRAALDAICPRLDQQIQIATVEEVLAAWPPERSGG